MAADKARPSNSRSRLILSSSLCVLQSSRLIYADLLQQLAACTDQSRLLSRGRHASRSKKPRQMHRCFNLSLEGLSLVNVISCLSLSALQKYADSQARLLNTEQNQNHLKRETPFLCNVRFRCDLPEVSNCVQDAETCLLPCAGLLSCECVYLFMCDACTFTVHLAWRQCTSYC